MCPASDVGLPLQAGRPIAVKVEPLVQVADEPAAQQKPRASTLSSGDVRDPLLVVVRSTADRIQECPRQLGVGFGWQVRLGRHAHCLGPRGTLRHDRPSYLPCGFPCGFRCGAPQWQSSPGVPGLARSCDVVWHVGSLAAALVGLAALPGLVGLAALAQREMAAELLRGYCRLSQVTKVWPLNLRSFGDWCTSG